jgi:REP element-mobilizing transposase RayT
MGHTYTNLLIHAIFSTTGRQPFLEYKVRPRVFSYIGGIVRDVGCMSHRIGGTDDHIHLLIGVTPTAPVADLMRLVKTNSSKWIHDTFPEMRAFA